MAVDFLLIALALLVAVMIRPQLNSLRFVREVSEFMVVPAVLYLIFPLMWVGILILFSVYDGQRNLRVVDELSSLTLGSIMAMVAIAGILFITYRDVSRVLYLVFGLFAYLSLVMWRVAFGFVFSSRNGKGEDRIRVLIAGAGKVGREFQLQISQNSFPDFSIIGFLDDDPEKRLNQNDVLGDLSETRDLVIEHNVTDVVLALPPQAFQRLSWLVSELHDLPIKVWVIPDYFRLAMHKAVFEEFAGVPLLDLRAPALNENQRMVKRSFDLIVTVILLPLLLPLMVLIALGVRFDSPGPIIFRQKRVGENGRIFEMYKFRTMVEDAEQKNYQVDRVNKWGSPNYKTRDDPRVTRTGHILRRTSLDELPQLMNVLKGEMSLVGPRPEQSHLVEQYEPWQRKRFAVPQGITGWWQIHGRSDKPMHLHTQEDLYYIQNYSIWLDLSILTKTVWVAIRGKGAY